MHIRHPARGALGALAALLLVTPLAVKAQAVNRCSDGTRAYWSDKPCPSNGATRITSYGPQPTRDAYQSGRPSKLEKAPDHQPYLSAGCASLNDAIRTARTRGVGYDTQQELREEYRRKCGEEDSEARKQWYEEESRRRAEARDQRQAQQQQRAQAATTQDQCREMGRIAAERRKRLDVMTSGERADFERFQANFAERCKGL